MRNSWHSQVGASQIHTWSRLPNPASRLPPAALRGVRARGPGLAVTPGGKRRGAVCRPAGSLEAARMSPGVCPAPASHLCSTSPSPRASRAAGPPQPGTLPAGRFPPSLPGAHLDTELPLRRRRNRGKKANRFLIMPCLLSFGANSAPTKVIRHVKRNIYLKKPHTDAWLH